MREYSLEPVAFPVDVASGAFGASEADVKTVDTLLWLEGNPVDLLEVTCQPSHRGVEDVSDPRSVSVNRDRT